MFTFTAVNMGMSESTIQVSVDPGLEGKYYAALVITSGALNDISGTATDEEVSVLAPAGSVTETSIKFETYYHSRDYIKMAQQGVLSNG